MSKFKANKTQLKTIVLLKSNGSLKLGLKLIRKFSNHWVFQTITEFNLAPLVCSKN